MEYILLWSGNIRGMKKTRIPATDAQGMGGHIGRHGLVIPDKQSLRLALPYRFRRACDRSGGFWFDKFCDDSPAHMELTDRRGRYLTTLYLQPIRGKESNNGMGY